jgi:hypothetical protein
MSEKEKSPSDGTLVQNEANTITIERKVYLNPKQDTFLQRFPARSHSAVVRHALDLLRQDVMTNPQRYRKTKLSLPEEN